MARVAQSSSLFFSLFLNSKLYEVNTLPPPHQKKKKKEKKKEKKEIKQKRKKERTKIPPIQQQQTNNKNKQTQNTVSNSAGVLRPVNQCGYIRTTQNAQTFTVIGPSKTREHFKSRSFPVWSHKQTRQLIYKEIKSVRLRLVQIWPRRTQAYID